MMEKNEEAKQKYDLEDRLIRFSLRIMDVVQALPKSLAGKHVAGQLLRCGTSGAPLYAEAQSAESRRDFVHKMKIALKELRETRVWLKMIERKPLISPVSKLGPIAQECQELIAIFVKSIATATRNDRLGKESRAQ